MSETPTATTFATEVAWTVATFAAATIVIYGGRKLVRTGLALKASKFSKVKP